MRRRTVPVEIITYAMLLSGYILLAEVPCRGQSAAGNTIASQSFDRPPALRTAVTPHPPISDTVVDPPFQVGNGDILSVSVWKEKELSPTVTVRPDGKISIPLIGEVAVSGLTPVEVEVLLRERLGAIVVHPQVTVTVVEIHSRMVYITGEVSRPGAYPLNTPLNVLQLIAQAGGLTEFASRKKIRIVKLNSMDKSIRFDYNRVLSSSDPSRNIPLSPGDTVVVP